jgi:hypothetical protein
LNPRSKKLRGHQRLPDSSIISDLLGELKLRGTEPSWPLATSAASRTSMASPNLHSNYNLGGNLGTLAGELHVELCL